MKPSAHRPVRIINDQLPKPLTGSKRPFEPSQEWIEELQRRAEAGEPLTCSENVSLKVLRLLG